MQNVTSVSIECTLGYQNVNQNAQRLSDVHRQHGHRAAVADEPDDHGAVDDGAQFVHLQDVEQKAGKERARAERDHSQVEKDPEPEREAVVHVRLVQAFDQAEPGGVEAEGQQRGPRQDPQQESAASEQRFTPRAINVYPRSSSIPGVRLRSRDPFPLRAVVDLRLGAERLEQAEAIRRAPCARSASFRSPNRMAPVGHASTQAGT